MPWEAFPSFMGGEQYSYVTEKEKVFDIPLIYVLNPNSVNKLFEGQKYSPKTIKEKGLKGYKTYVLKDLKLKPGHPEFC